MSQAEAAAQPENRDPGADEPLDLLVVGAGPTGIAIGAAAKDAGLSCLLVDQGPLCAAIQGYPTELVFFTTRDRLEIAGVPFTIPEVKPTRAQTLAYYSGVARRYALDLALHEEVIDLQRPAVDGDGCFRVTSVRDGLRTVRRAHAVAIATGYFFWPDRLAVPGEELPWVHSYYREPYRHFDQDVVIVGGGNTAVETALDLHRAGARVTLVHRRGEVKGSIKYWLKPDFENRVAEGSIAVRYQAEVRRFLPATEDQPRRRIEIETEEPGTAAPAGIETLPCDAAYVLIGYTPDVTLQRQAGVEIDDETLVPAVDPETCESNVPGLYVAGTIQAGHRTDQIFIENSRDHGERIVGHLLATRS